MKAPRGRRIFLVVIIVVAVIFTGLYIMGLISSAVSGKIGVIEVEGTIADLKEVMQDVVDFKDDDSIKGVILRINSPGGAVGPTQEMYSEIKKLRQKKKVYVSMGSVCASGGYYLAVTGEKIYANPSTITGSIGVIMEQAVVEDLMKKIGVEANTIKSGDMKDIGSPFRKMKDEEKKYLQTVIDNIYEQFVQDVAQGRKMQVDQVKQLADGRIFTGLQAKQVGLVDNIGTFYDVVADMQKTLGMRGKPELTYGKRPFSLLRWLLSSAVKDMIFKSTSSPIQFLYKP
ncbi:MAG TPA: signal peptide peptidase SppA [Syntrophorhabdaceae bacterium]|nr:signal peptide peptidase SppA [Syntrophorhabdaceae bacterium]